MILQIALGILLAVFLLATIEFWLPILIILAGLIVAFVIVVVAACVGSV